MEKIAGYTAKEWMQAFVEILDGNSAWHDIQYNTGLPEEDCRKLEEMFNVAVKHIYK